MEETVATAEATIEQMQAKIKELTSLNSEDCIMKLNTVKLLQEKFPNLIIGGSVALYLYGVKLERFAYGLNDLDITMPFYQKLDSEGIKVEDIEDRPSGSDYKETVCINGVKSDIRIDPTQKYEEIVYKGFTYKVIPLYVIIEAKCKYAQTKAGGKHRSDLENMLKITKN